jgi:hypothetical protein
MAAPRPWVYIASPYTRGDQAQNVAFQMRIWNMLLDAGATPIAPLWSHFQHLHLPRPYEDWTAYDNEIIHRCDACLRLSAEDTRTGYLQRESSGADAEVRLFRQMGKPVFFDVGDLLRWLDNERAYVTGCPTTTPVDAPPAPPPAEQPSDAVRAIIDRYQLRDSVTVVGIAGPIGAGKTSVAGMIPDACCLQWADPIYRGLAAMLGEDEERLRDRTNKERGLNVAGLDLTPRRLLQTLGTEWGRELTHPDLWVALTLRTIQGQNLFDRRTVFAICGTRFPNEAAAIRALGGEVWWVDRLGLEHAAPAAPVHVSDQMLRLDDCDRVIVNSGTPADLRSTVHRAWGDFMRDRGASVAGGAA